MQFCFLWLDGGMVYAADSKPVLNWVSVRIGVELQDTTDGRARERKGVVYM